MSFYENGNISITIKSGSTAANQHQDTMTSQSLVAADYLTQLIFSVTICRSVTNDRKCVLYLGRIFNGFHQVSDLEVTCSAIGVQPNTGWLRKIHAVARAICYHHNHY